ncbi:N-acetylmuramoyl-L-alanine amidase family protein [Clostridium sp.]|uniref:N-acetylmuramoyl-L-alanine amidase family protein n=1 Tax=Clostridium sp. TaxID=1506 RepID=UPI00283F6B36|nr:N-acetylmuramoyl-L-alanine amidase family protein [Clostridium sp.]MDR3595425.1 N-acetylmuramoyl-L-alanine amidase family protein [Clostridium sp.]
MIKRKNKITALLVAATSIMTLMPAMAADSSSRLGTKDGTIENAIAYKDGKYVYQGYKSDDDTDAIYYNDGNKDKSLDDLSSADLNTTYEDKYAFTNDGSDQYLVDLTNGSVTDDSTPADDIDTAATKLQTKLNKADRYKGSSSITVPAADLYAGQTSADNTILAIPGNKFGDTWYSYGVQTSASDATKYVDKSGNLYGFTDGSGKYIDASSTANIYAYSTKEGRTVKIEDYSNSYDDVDTDSGLLATLVQQPVALTQDNDYIYALVTVAITDTSSNAVATGATTATTQASVYTDAAATDTATTTLRTYIQKISKAQGDQKDGAYTPKTVESYEIGNYYNSSNGKTEYNCGDAHDAYDAILAAINDTNASVTDLTNVTQKDVIGSVSNNGIVKPIFTISNGNLVAIKATTDSVDAVTLKFKKDKLKFQIQPGYKTASTTTTSASVTSFDLSNKVDAYFVEKDSDDSVDLNSDAKSPYEAYDIDVNGNVWVIADGKIYEYKNASMTKVYTCDSGLDSINVYDENSMVIWEDGGNIYTTVNEGKAETDSEAPAPATTTTPAKVGWSQSADGSWNFFDATGTKVVNNWVNVGGIWYFLDTNGAMATGWKMINGSWYYLNPVSDGTKGAMKTGWINDNGTWYYLNSSGAMATGWLNDNGTWYYLNASGAMLASTTTPDGYFVGANGAWVK